MKLLIIGYGNPLRGDVGVGQAVIEQVETLIATVSPPLVGETVLIACHQLTPELAVPLAQVDYALFIDVRAGEPAGMIEVQPLTPAPHTGAFHHHLTPSALLANARALYGVAPAAAVCTINGTEFGYGETLSSPVQAACNLLSQRLMTFILLDSVHCQADFWRISEKILKNTFYT
jgi:hydrogenase maturation protease